MRQLRVASESSDERRQRLAKQREAREARTAKLQRTRHGGASDDVALANSFREIGIDILPIPRDQVFEHAKKLLEGQPVTRFSPEGINFISENFDVAAIDDGHRFVLHFKTREEMIMNLHGAVSETTGQKRKVCKEVYEGLVSVIQEELKENRRVRLPGIGIIKVKFSPAKPKRKGINPFTKEKMTFKAKPACNKVRVSVSKDLREFVDAKIKVVAPKSKKR